jgi:hypothetical protein
MFARARKLSNQQADSKFGNKIIFAFAVNTVVNYSVSSVVSKRV